MTTHLRFALLLTAGLFLPADVSAQGRGTGSGGMSGGCRSSGGRTSSSPPASTSTSSLSAYPYRAPPAASTQSSFAYAQYAAQQAYLARWQAAQAYQARFVTPQAAQTQTAPAPYTSVPSARSAPASGKPAADPKPTWTPPQDDRQYVPDELAVIKPDPVAVLAKDTAAYDRYLKALVSGDDLAVRGLDASGEVVSLTEPTEVAVLSRAGGFAFVRPTAGPQKDQTFVTRAKLTKPAAK